MTMFKSSKVLLLVIGYLCCCRFLAAYESVEEKGEGLDGFMRASPWTFGGVKAWQNVYDDKVIGSEGCEKATFFVRKTYCDRVLSLSAPNATSPEFEMHWKSTWEHICKVMPRVLSKRKMTHVALEATTNNIGDNILPRATRMAIEFFFGVRPQWYLINARRAPVARMITTASRSAGVVVGGGGLFYPANGNSQQTISGWQWRVSPNQLRAIERPILVFAVGWNAFRGQYDAFGGFPENSYRAAFNRSLDAMVHRRAWTGLGLREFYSLESIHRQESSFIPRHTLFYQPCATTLLAITHLCLGSRTLIDRDHTKKEKILSVNIASDRLENRLGNATVVNAVLDEVIVWLAQAFISGWTIHITLQSFSDTTLLRRLREKKVSFIYHVHRFPAQAKTEKDWLTIINYYRSVTVAASSRGHGVMIPFGVHTATISLITHEKDSKGALRLLN